jgi:ATP-binding cassette subfamily B protein/subfamily B ATP-binding cassette protein MsbA
VPYWRGWLIIACASALSSAVAVMQPWPMQVAVDSVLGSAPLSDVTRAILPIFHGGQSRVSLLTVVAVAGLLLYALGAALSAVLSWCWIRVGQSMVYDLAADLFAAVQRRSIVFHARSTVGDLLSRVTGDSWCVYRIVDTLIVTPIQSSLTAGVMLYLMFKMDARLTLASIAVVPFMAASALLLRKPLRAVARLRRDIEGRIHAHVHETLTGMPVVQSLNQESRQRARFEEQTEQAIRAHGRSVFIKSMGDLASGLLPTVGTAVVLWFGAKSVLSGRVSVGELLVFLAYLRGLHLNATKLTDAYATLQETTASADRVFELLETQDEIRESPDALTLDRVKGEITFENVVFGYESDQPVLKGITLHISPGQTVAIVGGTGAGKSTLAGLVARLFDPSSGRVLLDRQDVRAVTLASLRSQISLVLQEPFLFPVSIAENISYGRPDATIEQIQAAAQAAGAHDFVMRLPEGYGTIIGERGATLSGGERQRLSIARALLRDTPVLILDEPTSALDATTEASVLDAMRRLMVGRTTLMIAHRLSSVREADRIIVLERGQIIEDGTHEQLLQLNGRYATLWRTQMREPIHLAASA